MTLPLFSLFDLPDRPDLHDALRAAGPSRAWWLMQELAELDRGRYERESPEFERPAAIEALARKHMSAARAVSAAQAADGAARFATYGPRLQLECTFITLWLNDPATLWEHVVDVSGREHLDEALAAGHGVLAAPLHLGASYVIPPLLAHLAPTRLVFNRMNFAELRRTMFPDLDVEAYDIADGATFRRGLETLRRGHVFAMFPELDPRGQELRHRELDFLGARIRVPEGPMLLAERSGSPIVPIMLDTVGPGRFVLRFDAPITVDRGPGGRERALRALWDRIERAVDSTRIGDWEMWIEFDRMLATETTR